MTYRPSLWLFSFLLVIFLVENAAIAYLEYRYHSSMPHAHRIVLHRSAVPITKTRGNTHV